MKTISAAITIYHGKQGVKSLRCFRPRDIGAIHDGFYADSPLPTIKLISAIPVRRGDE